MQVDCLCIFEIAQKEIQCESKKVNFEKNILNLGRGGVVCVLFCPPQINDSIQVVLQYLYQSFLFMNEGRLQLTIRTKTNYPLTSE